MADRVIRIILTGDSAGAVRAMRVAGTAAETTQGKLAKLGKVGQGFKQTGMAMTQMAIPLVAVGGYAVKTAASFQESMTLIRTQTGATSGEVANMSKAIMALAPKSGEGPQALAQALYPIESVGLRGAAALAALKAAAMGAQVGGASLADTSDAVAGALRTQMFDVKSASDAMSIMNGIVGQGKMHLVDLIGAMQTGILPAAKNAGLGFRDVGAALAAMTRQGIPAQDAATRLRLNLTQFEAPKGAALKALSAIGLTQTSLADDLRKPQGLITALTDLQDHMSNLTKDQRSAVLSQAFGGAKGSANVVALLNALPMMRQISGSLAGASAAQLAGQFAERAKDASFKWQQMKASAQTALVSLGNALMPIVLDLLPKMTKLITGLAHWLGHLPKGIKEFLVGLTAFLAIGGPLLMLVGNLILAIRGIGMAFTFIADNPIVLVLAGIGVAAVLVATHFKQVRNWIIGAWQDIWHFIESAANWIAKKFEWLGRKAIALFKDTPLGGLIGAASNLAHGHFGKAAGSLIHGLTGGLLHDGGPVRAHYVATGGPIGTDTVPLWGAPGEYMLRREAVQSIGVNRLNAINQSGSLAGQGGGEMQPIVMPVTLQMGARVVAEEVLHFALRKNALSGAFS